VSHFASQRDSTYIFKETEEVKCMTSRSYYLSENMHPFPSFLFFSAFAIEDSGAKAQ
jgi:hypothetical protein